MLIMAKIVSTEVFIKYSKFHQHKSLASKTSNTEDVIHYMYYISYTELEGVGYFNKQLMIFHQK